MDLAVFSRQIVLFFVILGILAGVVAMVVLSANTKPSATIQPLRVYATPTPNPKIIPSESALAQALIPTPTILTSPPEPIYPLVTRSLDPAINEHSMSDGPPSTNPIVNKSNDFMVENNS